MSVSNGPKGISRSLVFSYDAANFKCYPRSGTSANDMSGNGSTATLQNSPGFSSAGSGAFTFDGTNQTIIAPENSILNTQTPTVEVWIKTNNTTQNGFFFEKGNVNTQYSLFQEGATVRWRQYIGGVVDMAVTTATYISTSSWAHIVGTYTSGTRCLYINGNLVNSDAQTGTINTNTNGISIGVYGGYNGSRAYYFNGSISIVNVYNRNLTASEVASNYRSLKSRFGL